MPPSTAPPPPLLEERPLTTLYISRHGESVNNLYGKIGGDSPLSPRGEQYARALSQFLNCLPLPGLEVWTSQYGRTQQTAQHLTAPRLVVPALGEICAGKHDGLTYEEIAAQFPVEFALRDEDKLRYRYPGGESYLDVVQRVETLLELIRKKNNLCIISHQATLRCLLSLLTGTDLDQLPYVQIPLHTVIKVVLRGEEVVMEHHRLPVDCVDTHRSRPDNCSASRGVKEACLTVPAHL